MCLYVNSVVVFIYFERTISKCNWDSIEVRIGNACGRKIYWLSEMYVSVRMVLNSNFSDCIINTKMTLSERFHSSNSNWRSVVVSSPPKSFSSTARISQHAFNFFTSRFGAMYSSEKHSMIFVSLINWSECFATLSISRVTLRNRSDSMHRNI